LCAALLFPFVLAGTIEIHRHRHSPGQIKASRVAVRLSWVAAHPGQPLNAEAGCAMEAPACAACLHSRTVRGLAPPAPPSVAGGASAERLAPDPAEPLSDLPAHRDSGRSPPLA
jgi:hypothetical protein